MNKVMPAVPDPSPIVPVSLDSMWPFFTTNCRLYIHTIQASPAQRRAEYNHTVRAIAIKKNDGYEIPDGAIESFMRSIRCSYPSELGDAQSYFQAFLDSGRGFGPVTSEQVDAVKVILDDMYDMDQRWYSGLA
jgi:hypothetical protein